MEIKEIIELMNAVSANGLTGFELEQGDFKLSMKREKKLVSLGGQGAAVSVLQTADHAPRDIAAAGADGQDPAQAAAGHEAHSEAHSDLVVSCPLVGTFYASPSPEAEDFVKVGDTVKKGQVLGIVEAMKLMNEIESEYDGVVEAILVKNEETVEYGQPLFRIR